MNSWFKKELGDAIIAAPVLETLKQQYSAMHAANSNPDAAQVWVRYDAAGGLHCEVTVYFSPAAAALAMSVDAEVCGIPSLAGASLLSGKQA